MTKNMKCILMETARILGIKVVEVSLSKYAVLSVHGVYMRYRNKDFIYIEKDDSQTEKTFTLAHELGHYVLHRTDLENKKCRNCYWADKKYQNEKEIEADYFAWRLLSFLYGELRKELRKTRHYKKRTHRAVAITKNGLPWKKSGNKFLLNCFSR